MDIHGDVHAYVGFWSIIIIARYPYLRDRVLSMGALCPISGLNPSTAPSTN